MPWWLTCAPWWLTRVCYWQVVIPLARACLSLCANTPQLPRLANMLMQTFCSQIDRLSRMHTVPLPRPAETLIFTQILSTSIEKWLIAQKIDTYARIASALRDSADNAKASGTMGASGTAEWEEVSKLAQRCLMVLESRCHTQHIASSYFKTDGLHVDVEGNVWDCVCVCMYMYVPPISKFGLFDSMCSICV